MNYWQDFVVLSLIAVAAGYLAYQLWCRLTRRAGCDACNGCPASSEVSKTHDTDQLLTISTPSEDASDK